MPKIYKIISLFIISIVTARYVYAEELFDTEFNVYYNIGKTGDTQISQDIKITNKQNDVVATNYTLTIKDINIYNVKGKDDEERIDVTTDVVDNITNITANFKRQVIGEDRSYVWNLSYDSKDIATKVGEIWNIHIPKVEILEVTKDYNIMLTVPNSFGPNIYISPRPTNEIVEKEVTKYFFNKESLQEKGISASFGKYQVLNFQLFYNLINESQLSSNIPIALPMDIKEKQQVYYSTLNPKPSRIYSDEDGNLLAEYKLKPKEQIQIELTGTARISGKQINPDFGGKFEDIPYNIRKNYTKEDKYWEVNSEVIQEIASTLKNPDQNVTQNAQNAYKYVVEKLTYDFDIESKDFVDRNGALKAVVDTGPWACMEFTDLFVAVARAMGVPAREINGYAFTRESNLTPLSINLKGGDQLHSWAEFYDPQFGWVQVDPTWGNTSKIDYFTKLDTSHFAFSIKGMNSQYPFPAGTYKVDGKEKQVQVDVAQNADSIVFEEKFRMYEKINLNPIDIFRNKESFIIENTGGLTLFNVGKTGKNLLPFSTMVVKLDSGINTLYIEDFNGVSKEKQIILSTAKPPKVTESTNSVVLAITLALLLCVMIYVFAIHPDLLQKLRNRLPHHPRGLNQ